MKTLLTIRVAPALRSVLTLFLILLVIISCDQNDPGIEQTGTIQFSLDAGNENAGGRVKTLKSVLISVKDANGQIIHQQKKISLFKFGEEYLSEPIALTTGNFKLTEFIIIDENNAAVYATPSEGSSLAHLVNDPLPVEFSITKDQTTKVSPEVIEVDGHTAADFGYVNFGFEIINTFKFRVGVLAYKASSGNFELTNFALTVKDGAEVLFNQNLPAATNDITVRSGHAGYALNVTKSGYKSYQKTFTAAELEAYASTPLVITLLENSLEEGLLAYYPFNGNAEDATASNFDGVVHGAVLTTDRKGTANASYSFDGINDYINVPHTNTLNLSGDFTISLWALVSSAQEPHEGINDILRKWNGTAEGYPFSISYLNPLAADNVEDKIMYVRYDGQTCANAPTSYSPPITNNQFIHIVLVKQGSVLRHYLNNVLIAEFTDTTAGSACSIANTADMTIGCRGNLVRFFKGKIDDIRIYSRAITASEVGNLYGE